ncbi:MAG: hypothetical protein LUE12_07045 [Ruminococcus sp.]|nr:hypothetical protein [Ruminococcus sp.]
MKTKKFKYKYGDFASEDEYKFKDANKRNIKDSNSPQDKMIQSNSAPSIIENILYFPSGNKFTSNLSKHKKKIYIYLALDDRMFVMCIVLDESYANQVRGDGLNLKNILHTYEFQRNDTVSRSVYELIYTDSPKNYTCSDPIMRSQMLNQQIYTR